MYSPSGNLDLNGATYVCTHLQLRSKW